LALAALALAAASTATSATSYKQPSFHETVIFSGLVFPTSVRFLPDGSVLVIEKSGLIKKYDSLTSTTPTVVADLRLKVHNFWDRGLMDLAIDPNFTTNHYIYVLYSNDAPIGGIAPKWGPGDGTSDPCPSPPGATTDGCVISGHLSRLTAIGSDWTASEQVLIEDWCQQFPSHSMDALAFGADGKLYMSAGEGGSFLGQDYGQLGGTSGTPPPTPKNPCGDPPVPVGGNQTPPTAEGGSLRSQSPRRTAGEPRVLNGSILRLDPITGAAAPGNPLFGSSDANERRIIGYGLRNPFRMIVKPGTNDVWVGDVGSGSWEEIDRIPDLLSARNFGWPCFEGPATGFTGFNICPTQAQTVAPFFTYSHSQSVVPGDGCPTGSSAIAGMAFYQGASNYPSAYNGALFFSDYSRLCMWVMFPGGNGDPDPTTRVAFASSAQGPVDLQIGPDGNLYYVDFDGGKIWRIEYGPIAMASANPTYGALPLTVNFSSAGSVPAQTGDTITFAWDLDGDGQFDDSTAANPAKTYTVAGNVTVRLKVTDNHGAFNISSPVVISPGNTPPTATVLTPAASLTWKVGDTISFSGSATDAEQGTLPPSALSWSIIIHHCPTNCHTHIYQTFSGVAGGSFPAPDHDYPSYLEIQLTATDSGGLTGSASVNINPQTVDFNMASIPSGLQLTAGTITAATPFVKTVIVNSQVVLDAPSPQGAWQFSSWSDGGARTHTVTAPATGLTFTATYTSPGGSLPPPWLDQDVGTVAAVGSASYSAGTFTVKGSGVDIWDAADHFHYVYQSVSGDATVIARVASLQNTNPWAKTGVMIRETLATGSKHAMMALTPGNGLAFQRRLSTGGASASTLGALVAAPY
jgi:glucose/arabinose dehydrogenase/PKD repeat protein